MPPVLSYSRALLFRTRSIWSMSHSTLPSVTVTVKPRLRGVVFDMDGTLTVPVIDFPAMYKAVLGEERYRAIKLKSPSGIDILHHIESWSPEEQQKAYGIIADFERDGLDRLQIMPGEAICSCYTTLMCVCVLLFFDVLILFNCLFLA